MPSHAHCLFLVYFLCVPLGLTIIIGETLGLIEICRVILGVSGSFFDPDMQDYCGGIMLNVLIQICRAIVGVSC
jgi:hypothetical protein